ncbi:uncharacterized protein BX664DRAFT_29059 [Halteromyces radiatus]|uniref:uncharacterized protein n=1 Tax=Halteromyces radiatus TaxID=101107 RepID=UPI00221EB203|nr:uncharacterized protein BX664DRAFT_29059 [Halteromyces radiatus]KAI8099851.1 hypothetical protein BX664DRAFT_29059 [Halteromyces radiatus]
MNAELKQALLELKQQDRDDEYSSLVNLLSKIPKLPNSYSIYSKQSGWTVLWKEWHAEVELVWKEYERTGLFDEDSYDSNGLHITIQLLMGDQDTIMGQDDFYKRMLANLIYTDPMEHQFDMAYIATHSFDDHMDNSIEHILVYYLLTRRYHELLGAMDDYLWLQTHFGHILFAAGYLTSGQDEQLQKSLVTKTIVSEQITEPIHYLIKLYASTIAQEYGMWIEAMQCLLSCQPNTEVWIQKLLGDPPLASENINCLINALDFSITHHLIKVEIVLHSAIATRYESNQDFVLAATHYADGNNIQALDTLAAKHLEYYLGNGTLRPVVTDSKYIKLVDQSGPYSFYRRYVQVRANIKEGQLDDAYRTIMTLLHSLENASSKYRVVLLVDIFDIIRDYRRVNKQEAQELLSQLEVATKEPTEKAFFAVYYKQSHSDTIIARLRERLGFSLAADALSL